MYALVHVLHIFQTNPGGSVIFIPIFSVHGALPLVAQYFSLGCTRAI